MGRFNFQFDNVGDAATALSILDGMSLEQQREFSKSEYGQELIKAAGKAYAENPVDNKS